MDRKARPGGLTASYSRRRPGSAAAHAGGIAAARAPAFFWTGTAAVLGALLALVAPVAAGGERWDAIRGLPRVAVEVTLSPNHPDLSPEDVRKRIEDGLRRAQPAPALDPGSSDRLHLMVSVRPYSSSDLRGYYLPLSQAYGIGPVRLAVERMAVVPGLGTPTAAQVWQAERQAKGPWRASAAEILELADEVVASFLGDYRRAQGQ
jgi:hypothetical protein